MQLWIKVDVPALTDLTFKATWFEVSQLPKGKGDSHSVLYYSTSGSSTGTLPPMLPTLVTLSPSRSSALRTLMPSLLLPWDSPFCANTVLTSFSSQGGYLSKGNFQESCISVWVSCHHSHYLILNWASSGSWRQWKSKASQVWNSACSH